MPLKYSPGSHARVKPTSNTMKDIDNGFGREDDIIDINMNGDVADICRKEYRAQLAMFNGRKFSEKELSDHLTIAIHDWQMTEEQKREVEQRYKAEQPGKIISAQKGRGKYVMRKLREGKELRKSTCVDALMEIEAGVLIQLAKATHSHVDDAWHLFMAKKATADHNMQAIQLDFEFLKTLDFDKLEDLMLDG